MMENLREKEIRYNLVSVGNGNSYANYYGLFKSLKEGGYFELYMEK